MRIVIASGMLAAGLFIGVGTATAHHFVYGRI